MTNLNIRLQPLIREINLPTVIKTAIPPGDTQERLFIATQVGEIFYLANGMVRAFLDIRPLIMQLGAAGGYDERGLLGMAFHPLFQNNGLFYLHYSLAGSQGPGALRGPFIPNPCDSQTLGRQWTNRGADYDHIDTVEEWISPAGGAAQKRRTLLNLRRPFMNHNGVNSLNFSPESGRLVLTTGDGGLGYDPFNLSQDELEIAGKIIEIDVAQDIFMDNPPIVACFDELPLRIQETLTLIAKGVRNIPGISYQKFHQQYIKYAGNVGQDLVESVFSFVYDRPRPVADIVRAAAGQSAAGPGDLINLGWRGWEGVLPTAIIRDCPDCPARDEKIIAYYEEAVLCAPQSLEPLTCYFHQENRPGKAGGSALTGVQPYLGAEIPGLTGNVVFCDLAATGSSPARGFLAYTSPLGDRRINDFSLLDVDYDFGAQAAYYVSLGANLHQTQLYLGVYASTRVIDYHQGTVFAIIP
ncbi:MAG: glucose dehydrogenase [Clostridia bacterium]|nr:glucose dehydrogenase [Clostridia bacterium]